MDTSAADRRLRRTDRGVTSVQFLLAATLGLLLFVGMLNLVVVQYGRGAIQSALEQGVRAASIDGDLDVCRERVGSVVGQLLGGRLSDGLEFDCFANGRLVTASASVTFNSWTPLTPDFEVWLTAEAAVEPS